MVPVGGAAHLDFGCEDASFLNSLCSKGINRLVGADICREVVGKARARYPDLENVHLTRTVPLPFPDMVFTSITALDVIEHVWEQKALLDELYRVLADDGVLVITVPGQHFLSFLDQGNLKFRFPRLHRWYYCRRHSQEEYEQRYVSSPNGLVGDISAAKAWHEHFNRNKLRRLLAASRFEVADFDGCALFGRAIIAGRFLLGSVEPLRAALDYIAALDNKWFESTHLFCRARKEARHLDQHDERGSASGGV